MAIIGPCKYDAPGQLVHPDRINIAKAKAQTDLDIGEGLTLDADHVHVHVINVQGRTPAETREHLRKRLRRFCDVVEWTNGYREMSRREDKGRLGGNLGYSITCEIVYAIEGRRRPRP